MRRRSVDIAWVLSYPLPQYEDAALTPSGYPPLSLAPVFETLMLATNRNTGIA